VRGFSPALHAPARHCCAFPPCAWGHLRGAHGCAGKVPDDADSKRLGSLSPAGAHASARAPPPGRAAAPAQSGRAARARRMVAAFGSGVAFSLVSGMASGASPLQGAFTTGVFFALFQGAFHKARARVAAAVSAMGLWA